VEVGSQKKEEMWRRKKEEEKSGGEAVFIFFQWLKDRKILGSATSSDKMGRNAGEPIETRVTFRS
jgi:hypothetical protein